MVKPVPVYNERKYKYNIFQGTNKLIFSCKLHLNKILQCKYVLGKIKF